MNKSKLFLINIIFLCSHFNGLFSQDFTVSGTKILDPIGNEFIPYGANVNGGNYFTWGISGGDWKNYQSSELFSAESVNEIINGWKFNFLRANLWLNDPTWNGVKHADGWITNPQQVEAHIDKLVTTYTAKCVVVMLEIHDFTCGDFPGTSTLRGKLKDFWRMAAKKYRNNPYVWFNIMNEPGWYGNGVDAAYRDIHREMIAAIRAEGVSNIIIVDGSQCGQDANSWDNNPISENMSGILKYGQAIISENTNVAFTIHMYDQWGKKGSWWETKFNDYITRVRQKGLCLSFIGEVGTNGEDIHADVTRFAFEVALKKHNLGLVAWHYTDGDGFSLCTGNTTWGSRINSLQNPTNLSTLNGVYFWKGTHELNYGYKPESCVLTAQPDRIMPMDITVYPSPVNDKLTLIYELSGENKIILLIYDMLGNEVVKKMRNLNEGSNKLEIDAASMEEGIYVIKARAGDEQVIKKFVVNH